MTDFLYPFLEREEREERDASALLADLAESAAAKATQSEQLRSDTLAGLDAELDIAAEAMAERFAAGGRLFAFGNGGSATDADDIAALFCRPPFGEPLPARSIAGDAAVLTALANDVGFELVFSRQLLSMAGSGDVALGLSTSGSSVNLIRAFADARRLGVLTVGLAGYDGGSMADAGTIDHCLVIASDSVHRIQETQRAVAFDLWARVQCLVQAGAHGD